MADLVACGSEEVAEQVRSMGVSPRHVLLTPTGVDLELFDPSTRDPSAVRDQLGVTVRFVVGWVGSFRRFHALDHAVEAMVGLPRTTLLLVGDGPERARIERLASERCVDAVTTGTVPHEILPSYLAAMDAALVLAPEGSTFHYSPLKLAEYLASGLPVVAPRASQLAARLRDGEDALLVSPHDRGALAAALATLEADAALRTRLGQAARASAVRDWSWDVQIQRIVEVLDGRRGA
jgi:glycosyltransferase involved in cell wall biosynthesis